MIFQQLCVNTGLPQPQTEYQFHPKRKWRADYAWPGQRLILEVEGGVWAATNGTKSRHFTGTGALKDMEKYNEAAALGFRILRVQPKDLLKQSTIELIRKSLHT